MIGVDAYSELVNQLSIGIIAIDHSCLAVIDRITHINVPIARIHPNSIQLVATSIGILGCFDERSHRQMTGCDIHFIDVIIDDVKYILRSIHLYLHIGLIRIERLIHFHSTCLSINTIEMRYIVTKAFVIR